MERGVFRGIVIGALIWLIILLLWFCNCGIVENTNFDPVASMGMTEEEALRWGVEDVIPPIISIAAEPFRCGGVENADGCVNGTEDIILFQGIVGQVRWGKYETCHSDIWYPRPPEHRVVFVNKNIQKALTRCPIHK